MHQHKKLNFEAKTGAITAKLFRQLYYNTIELQPRNKKKIPRIAQERESHIQDTQKIQKWPNKSKIQQSPRSKEAERPTLC